MLKFAKGIQSTVKHAIKNQSKALIVTGNEAADMDSCASSMLTAYLYSKSTGNKQKVIPVINIPRDDFKTRPDIVYLFEKLGITSDHLVFEEEFKEMANANCELSAFLVDHNKLVGDISSIFEIKGIIDHHADEGCYKNVKPRIIEKCGSCASLVIDHFRKKKTVDNAAFSDFELIQLALAPILLDTTNMEHRVEDSDVRTVKFLKKLLKDGQDIDTVAFFQTLQNKKSDLSALSVNEILRKDYKQWEKLGISSVPRSLDYLITRHADLEGEMEKMSKDRGLDVYAIMTSFKSEIGEFKREIALHCANTKMLTAIQRFVGCDELQFENKEFVNLRAFDQKNISCSRKQVAPLLRSYVQGTALENL